MNRRACERRGSQGSCGLKDNGACRLYVYERDAMRGPRGRDRVRDGRPETRTRAAARATGMGGRIAVGPCVFVSLSRSSVSCTMTKFERLHYIFTRLQRYATPERRAPPSYQLCTSVEVLPEQEATAFSILSHRSENSLTVTTPVDESSPFA